MSMLMSRMRDVVLGLWKGACHSPAGDWMSLLLTVVALNLCANPQALVRKDIFKWCEESLLAEGEDVSAGLVSCHVLAKLQ